RLYLHASVVGRDDGDSALTIGTPGEARGVGPPAPRPSGALWGLPRAAQPPAGGDPAHPAPTGAGREGGAHRHPVLALGQAAGPRLWAGDAHLSVVPSRHPASYGRHHPGVSDHAYLAASPARVRSTSHGPGPCSPRTLHIRLSPRPMASSPRRRACGAWARPGAIRPPLPATTGRTQ